MRSLPPYHSWNTWFLQKFVTNRVRVQNNSRKDGTVLLSQIKTSFQPSMHMCLARSTTCAHNSFSFCHNFKLQCFQRLQMIASNLWRSSKCSSYCRRRNTTSVVDVVDWTICYSPAWFQTWKTNGQWKKTCSRSSSWCSQLTQWVGHWTLLSCRRILVGKTPRKFAKLGS